MKKSGRLFHFLAAALLSCLTVAGHAGASGFALREQSAAAQGNAFAGATAAAEDVTYLFFNPAALGRLENSEVAGVLTFIAPKTEFRGGSASTASLPPALPSFSIQGSQEHDDVAEDAFVPSLYGMWAVSDHLRLGLGVNAPFGLESRYDSDWVGRYHAIGSELKTVNINPVVAWRVTDRLSFGVGFQAQRAEATLSNALDFGTIGTLLPPSLGGAAVPGASPGNPAQDGFFKLDGEDWGFGWNAGLLFEPRPGTRFGLAFRSQIEHSFDGDADFTVPEMFSAAFAPSGLFRDTGAEADLTTPESWSFGAYHEINPRWAIMAEAAGTRWSRFDELVIDFDNPAQPDNVTEEEWNDTTYYAFGVTFRPSNAWALRGGVAWDESPVPDATRTPRIPDEDRTWLSLGVQWRPTAHLVFDAGLTHIWVDDSELDLKATGTGNTFRGNLAGTYDNAIDIATVQATWQF